MQLDELNDEVFDEHEDALNSLTKRIIALENNKEPLVSKNPIIKRVDPEHSLDLQDYKMTASKEYNPVLFDKYEGHRSAPSQITWTNNLLSRKNKDTNPNIALEQGYYDTLSMYFVNVEYHDNSFTTFTSDPEPKFGLKRYLTTFWGQHPDQLDKPIAKIAEIVDGVFSYLPGCIPPHLETAKEPALEPKVGHDLSPSLTYPYNLITLCEEILSKYWPNTFLLNSPEMVFAYPSGQNYQVICRFNQGKLVWLDEAARQAASEICSDDIFALEEYARRYHVAIIDKEPEPEELEEILIEEMM